MRLPEFEHLQPGSLDQALELLGELGEQAKVIAGGTELLVSMKLGLLSPAYLVNVKELPELNFISFDDSEGLKIGALTKLATLVESEVVRQHFPILGQAAAQVAAPPLQQMGTLGGNLCLDTRCFYYNQSRFWRHGRPPCYKGGGDVCHAVKGGNRCHAVYQGDIAPALIALGATVKIANEGGERVVALASLYTGKGEKPLAIKPDEILVEVQIPESGPRSAGDYQKLRYRGAMDFPLVGVAAVLGKNGSDICSQASVALTAVGTAPIFVEEADELLRGQSVSDELADRVADAAYNAAHPVSNIGSTPAYRRKMVRVLTKRAIRSAWERE